jgi:hypothetical protein
MGALRDFDGWEKSLRNFEWIDGVAPGATDLDLVIEKNGHFLVIEDKPFHDGVSVALGQHIALSALVRLDAFTVILQGRCEDDESAASEAKPFRWVEYGTFPPLDRGAHRFFPGGLFAKADEDDMRQLVRRWVAYARA